MTIGITASDLQGRMILARYSDAEEARRRLLQAIGVASESERSLIEKL